MVLMPLLLERPRRQALGRNLGIGGKELEVSGSNEVSPAALMKIEKIRHFWKACS